MILDALHTTLNPVLDAYPLIGDIEATLPFCMFKVDTEHVRGKQGIMGYKHTVLVGIAAATIDECDSFTDPVIAAITSMSGTIETTVFNGVLHTGESGIYMSEVPEAYVNDLEFTIYTDNR